MYTSVAGLRLKVGTMKGMGQLTTCVYILFNVTYTTRINVGDIIQGDRGREIVMDSCNIFQLEGAQEFCLLHHSGTPRIFQLHSFLSLPPSPPFPLPPSPPSPLRLPLPLHPPNSD